MSARTTSTMKTAQIGVYEEGIACEPDALFKGLAGCFGFLLTCTIVASLGIIAGGVFWTAQNVDRITDKDNSNFVMMRIV